MSSHTYVTKIVTSKWTLAVDYHMIISNNVKIPTNQKENANNMINHVYIYISYITNKTHFQLVGKKKKNMINHVMNHK